jgi:hypothetical protein
MVLTLATDTRQLRGGPRRQEEAGMQVRFNTDDQIVGRDELARRVEAEVGDALDRFSDRITRVEIHVSDENSARKRSSAGGDKRCLIEARLAGRQPVATSHIAATIDDAVSGASEKLKRLLDGLLGKLEDARRGAPVRPDDEGA